MATDLRQRPPLVVVLGPTAAGKSALALELAERLGGEVISADSQQVYRCFDIGTGKLTAAEQRGVPHHLIDVADPLEPFSAARFVELADQTAAEISGRGRPVVVAGGTGLYVRALLCGLFEAPPADPALRQAHRQLWQRDPQALRQQLAAVDPQAAARIAPADLVRISRALEVYAQTGQPISELQQRHAFGARRYRALRLGLAPPREQLRSLIEARVEQMMAQGWLAEVEQLLERGYGAARPMGALGYRQLRAHLQGELDLSQAIRQTKRDTWRFARRQLNWFSSEPEVIWYNSPVEQAHCRARDFLAGKE